MRRGGVGEAQGDAQGDADADGQADVQADAGGGASRLTAPPVECQSREPRSDDVDATATMDMAVEEVPPAPP